MFRVTENEVAEIIDKLDKKSSAGDDHISNQIIKESKNEVVPILTVLINHSWKESFLNLSKKFEIL